ncbi:MAG TPA: rhodanese-like domain-containing protein [Hydrogenophaga sp.]|uniref:rhodanese-like domain-containing protein n=1 Tax=Hydrogenophaga sp. TaxID=1904254 RepID=UPI002C218F39|nr:rhodanese-like domain-containing protein [Hydrogenophaga sp.]HMN91877.1 rhodanese-like domain-containing protein [Hydrogenophaga sp.]HMP08983.1 rhodanese-like domain-containing protein [Hydrogenophaga sp.]
MKPSFWGLRPLHAMLLGCAGLMATTAWGIEPEQVPVTKRSTSGLHLTAEEAAELKRRGGDGVLFIDIRTRAELTFVGVPSSIDYQVPFLEFPEIWQWSDDKAEFIQMSNPHFVQDIEQRLALRGLDKSSAVVLICRSGVRSNSASGLLALHGFQQAYTVIDGFEGDTAREGKQRGQRVVNGWKNAGLPWSYKLDKSKVYLDDPL